MAGESRDQVVELFLAACDLPEDERDAFLIREAAQDGHVLAEVRSLLEADRAASRSGGTAVLADAIRMATTLDAMPDEGRPHPPRVDIDAADESAIGRRLGDYVLMRRLGAGGAGTVFEAWQVTMKRRVALKILFDNPAFEGRLAQRFEQEAWIGGRLNHPGIVRVYERGTADGVNFYSMELVEGGSLHDVLQSLRATGRDDRTGFLAGSREYASWAIRQIVNAARALATAHRDGVVHRDIKPMNLLLDSSMQGIKIADFGIALDADFTRVTTEGRILGTPRYMAPEQLLGKRAVGTHADIYALGVTLFEMLTLDYPYVGETFERYVSEVIHGQARRVRSLNDKLGRDLEVVVGKALEKDPRDRYATVDELADDLENVLHFRPITARPPGRATRVGKWIRRKPVHAALLAVLVVGVPTGGSLVYRAQSQGRQLRDAEIARLTIDGKRFNLESRYGESANAATRLLELAPDNLTAIRTRAVARFNLSLNVGDDLTRERLMQDALADMHHYAELAPTRAAPLRLRAHMLRRWNRGAEAQRDEQAAASLEHGGSEDLFFDALLARLKGDYAEAETILDTLIDRGRRDVVEDRAFVRFKQDKFDAALEDYRVLAMLNGQDPFPQQEIGRILTLLGRFDEADTYLQRAATLGADEPDTFQRLSTNDHAWGRQLVAEGRLDEANTRFEAARSAAERGIALDAERPSLHTNLGAALIELHRLDPDRPGRAALALASFRTALSLTDDLPDSETTRDVAGAARSNLCDTLIELRRLDEALDVCSRVVDIKPRNDVAAYNLAGVHALRGDADEALRWLEQDLELGDTEHEWLRSDPWFESLRGDPRFESIVARMKQAAESANTR